MFGVVCFESTAWCSSERGGIGCASELPDRIRRILAAKGPAICCETSLSGAIRYKREGGADGVCSSSSTARARLIFTIEVSHFFSAMGTTTTTTSQTAPQPAPRKQDSPTQADGL